MFNILFSVFVLTTSFLFGLVAPEFKASRISDPPIIDGYLNDPCWQEATRMEENFRNWIFYDPDYGMIAPVKTVVLVGYDAENLYFGFICDEPDMTQLRTVAKNQNWWYPLIDDDHISIYLNTFVDRTEEYIFQVNPNGIRGDYFLVEERLGFYSYADYANIVWYAAAVILDSFWTVEVRIPFQSLRFPSTYIDYWRIDFRRARPRQYEIGYRWSPDIEGRSSFTYMGKMYINDKIRSPKKTELLPYGLSGVTIDTMAKGIKDPSLRLGLGAKYFLNYDNVIDFAVLPDFSQIESDAPQIDVNTTFALYYTEKRPFFMERKAFFETPLEAFYSRMINDPIGAVKYTGSIKDYAIGYISAYDQHSPFIVPLAERSFSFGSDIKSLSTILRLKKTIKTDTHLGLLATDRELLNSGFNRLVGLDGTLTFFGNNSMRYQGLVSWTKEPLDTVLFNGYELTFNDYTASFDNEEFKGQAFLVEAGHKDKYITFNGYCQGLSPEFRADNGYITYNDYTKVGFSVDYQYGLKKYFIEYIKPGIKFEQSHRYFGEKAGISRAGSIILQFKQLISTQFSYQLLDKSYQDNWFNDLWSYNSSISVSTIKNFYFGFLISYARQINYYSLPYGTGYSLLPSGWLKLTFGPVLANFSYYRYQFWQSKYGDWLFNQQVFETNFSYTFSRNVNFRILCQYNSYSKNLFFSPLFSFLPTSLTLFYFGSNHNIAINNTLFDIQGYDQSDSRVFLKIQYQLRY